MTRNSNIKLFISLSVFTHFLFSFTCCDSELRTKHSASNDGSLARLVAVNTGNLSVGTLPIRACILRCFSFSLEDL